ncbi:SGNH/GDSL hydrolase family protein [Geminicoccus flavidas]|uniref:SGNH/GDSL hydrolase family protein n=1 Tax=Geminicoccus flavidas TaxID=2506407 RepID=UPI001356EDFE
MTEQVRADPAAFGFTDIVTPCSGATRCEGHLFWDQVHPTTYAHGRLAEAALRELAGQDPPP